VVSAGDEHGEDGHLIEDAETPPQDDGKAHGQTETGGRERLGACALRSRGSRDHAHWLRSTKGSHSRGSGNPQQPRLRAQGVHLPQVFPLPKSLEQFLQQPAQKFIVESNYSGQLEDLIAGPFRREPTGSIRRYDGRPMNAKYILDRLPGGECHGR